MATTIGFADDAHPMDEKKGGEETVTSTAIDDKIRTRPSKRTLTNKHSFEDNDDGIYNMRSVTRTFSRSHSKPRDNTWGWKHGAGDLEDDDPGLHRESDFRQKKVYHGRLLFWLAYQSVGAIYGDIGTSPLYVFSSTFTEPPNRQDLIGVLSIIIWSLTMMVTLKYVLVILRADNNGEGGTFSTYSLLSRYVSVCPLLVVLMLLDALLMNRVLRNAAQYHEPRPSRGFSHPNEKIQHGRSSRHWREITSWN